MQGPVVGGATGGPCTPAVGTQAHHVTRCVRPRSLFHSLFLFAIQVGEVDIPCGRVLEAFVYTQIGFVYTQCSGSSIRKAGLRINNRHGVGHAQNNIVYTQNKLVYTHHIAKQDCVHTFLLPARASLTQTQLDQLPLVLRHGGQPLLLKG